MTSLPILVAHDGSTEARHALRWAVEESLRTHVPVRVLLVDEVLPPTWAGVPGWVPMTGALDVPTDDALAYVDGIRKELADAGAVDGTVVHGAATWSTSSCARPRPPLSSSSGVGATVRLRRRSWVR